RTRRTQPPRSARRASCAPRFDGKNAARSEQLSATRTAMDVIRGHRHAPPWPGAAVAIGNFHGVHVGHRAVVARARELAAAHDARTVVLTFDPHPAAVVGKCAPVAIASLPRRLELLAAAGADAVVIEPFTRDLAGCSPSAFVDDLVIDALR